MNGCEAGKREKKGAPIRSADHSSFTSSGSQISFGKLVVRSSTSTNSTSFVYRCGLRKDRLDMSESLKCFGFCRSRFRAWNCASFACKGQHCSFSIFLSRVQTGCCAPRYQDRTALWAHAECPTRPLRVWEVVVVTLGSSSARQ